MEVQLRCALPGRDAMAAAIGALGVAEAKLKDAQQQLVEKREALAREQQIGGSGGSLEPPGSLS